MEIHVSLAMALRIVQDSSFAEVCKTGLLDLVTLRNARDETWPYGRISSPCC